MQQDQGGTYPLVDTHAHLTWASFTDVPAVVQRARDAGLTRILTAATDLESARAAISLARLHPEVYAAVGIHPNDVRPDDSIDAVRDLADDPKVVAIGETGLDYYRDYSPHELQRASFEAHLTLAAERDLPVIVHNRNADGDVLAMLLAYRGRLRGVLHCFSGDYALASAGMDCGLFISFAGNLTYPSARGLREVATQIPLESLLVETDSPFLSPVPHRGKQNQPANVRYTVEALAACRGVDPVALAERISANAAALFRWTPGGAA